MVIPDSPSCWTHTVWKQNELYSFFCVPSMLTLICDPACEHVDYLRAPLPFAAGFLTLDFLRCNGSLFMGSFASIFFFGSLGADKPQRTGKLMKITNTHVTTWRVKIHLATWLSQLWPDPVDLKSPHWQHLSSASWIPCIKRTKFKGNFWLRKGVSLIQSFLQKGIPHITHNIDQGSTYISVGPEGWHRLGRCHQHASRRFSSSTPHSIHPAAQLSVPRRIALAMYTTDGKPN